MTKTGPNLTDCNCNRRLQLTGLYDLSVAGFTLCQKKHDREKPVITGCDRFFLPNKVGAIRNQHPLCKPKTCNLKRSITLTTHILSHFWLQRKVVNSPTYRSLKK